MTPKFPVVVKIGHAHAGMGKVSVISYCHICQRSLGVVVVKGGDGGDGGGGGGGGGVCVCAHACMRACVWIYVEISVWCTRKYKDFHNVYGIAGVRCFNGKLRFKNKTLLTKNGKRLSDRLN